jgi:hypothetical protein
MRVSMSSRAPVSSPTEIICTTICGNTVDWRSGAAIVSPSRMLARAAMIAFWTTRLPAVRAVISRPFRIGTPEEMSVASVRVKRATAPFRSTSPSTGTFKRNASIWRWPFSVL